MGTSHPVVRKLISPLAEHNTENAPYVGIFASVKKCGAYRVSDGQPRSPGRRPSHSIPEIHAERGAPGRPSNIPFGTRKGRRTPSQSFEVYGFPTVFFVIRESRPVSRLFDSGARHSRRSHRLPRARDAIAHVGLRPRSKYFRLART